MGIPLVTGKLFGELVVINHDRRPRILLPFEVLDSILSLSLVLQDLTRSFQKIIAFACYRQLVNVLRVAAWVKVESQPERPLDAMLSGDLSVWLVFVLTFDDQVRNASDLPRLYVVHVLGLGPNLQQDLTSLTLEFVDVFLVDCGRTIGETGQCPAAAGEARLGGCGRSRCVSSLLLWFQVPTWLNPPQQSLSSLQWIFCTPSHIDEFVVAGF